jgi:hypothetical protein
MTLTLQEISDRFEIMDILIDYCTAIDSNCVDDLDHVFTEDALIDYSKAGGPKGPLATIKTFLKQNLGTLPRQHMISNQKIRIEGDSASVRSLCHNPLELQAHGTSPELVLWGLWYNDKFIRTPQGWKIQERATEVSYSWRLQRSVN